MSGGGSGNQVTRVEPPSYQLPYLQSGLSQAQTLYNQGKEVVPFSPQTEAALQGISDRAVNGSPITGAAGDYVTKSLNGGFMGQNPYLDATFNKAALSTQNQLASEFGRSGRNVDQSEGLRSQQLNDLATGIYGGAYNTDRSLQQGTLAYAQPLANQDYTDLQALQGVGGQVEGLAQKYADAPGANLDQYLARVRGTDYGQTQVGPAAKSNAAGGILGGALAGSSLGPWGALGGAVLGGIFG
jgi:hypothetical protein